MGLYSDFLKDFNEFKKEYQKELEIQIGLLEEAHTNALAVMDWRTASEAFCEIKDFFEDFKNLSDLDNKIGKIPRLKHKFEKEIIRLSPKYTDNEREINKEEAINDVYNRIDEITYYIKDTNKKITYKTKQRKNIIKSCEFGQEENRTENALEFQRNVVELFGWLFLDEMKLLTKEELIEKQLKRDGVFEVDRFDFDKREIKEIRFSHLIIECKNYRKPSYMDLMQVYAYTLRNKITALAHNPLCLIVSRENPSCDSVALKMRDKLFENDGDKFLLVLFLSCDDLFKMVELKERAGDPFFVINEKIKEILRRNISGEF